MKKEKIFEFQIEKPLTAQRRKAVEKYIEKQAELNKTALEYGWAGADDTILEIAASPIEIEVRFQEHVVELYGAAPLWARLLFTDKKKGELKAQIEVLLREAKFISAAKTA
ncbi:hypothetical protein V5F53_15310 [Xanthobacter sp. V4C-4]|uniref:hypothetical protein n=1 Tax=Xanthobacter cornucopiae TaxID=3119924 RepID=UPI003728C2A7